MPTVAIKDIRSNPFQARQAMDAARIQELAEEIKQTGFWNSSLRARPVDGHYELVFGHRRLEALKLLGERHVDVEVVELDDVQMATQALVENLQREGLTDIEKANGIKRLLTLDAAAPTTKKVAEMLGYSESTIKEFRRLADLDAGTQQAVQEAHLSRTAIRGAAQIGGADFIRIAAQKNLNRDTLDDIQNELGKLAPPVREKIQHKLKSGALAPEPKRIASEGRRLAAKPKKKSAPPDLHEVLMKYTVFIRAWRKELQAIAPYREYIDTDPINARRFREQVKGLIEDLQKLL